MYENHSCTAYFVTLTATNKTNSKTTEWEAATGLIDTILNELVSSFNTVGGIFSIEGHKKSSKSASRGKDKLSGFPHFHMVLWLNSPFYDLNLSKVQEFFLKKFPHYDSRVSFIPKKEVAAQKVLYTIKEFRNENYSKFCKRVLSWESNLCLWCNHHDCIKQFKSLDSLLPNHHFIIENKICFPTVIRNQDKSIELFIDKQYLYCLLNY